MDNDELNAACVITAAEIIFAEAELELARRRRGGLLSVSTASRQNGSVTPEWVAAWELRRYERLRRYGRPAALHEALPADVLTDVDVTRAALAVAWRAGLLSGAML